jgi:Flp pilus assembly protein TadB
VTGDHDGSHARRHEHPHVGHLRQELSELQQAAIEAELETGSREETLEQARRHVLLRLVRVVAGVIVVTVGVALLALPGPGLVVVAAGLVLLSRDVPFARRLLEKVRERLPEDADGKVSPVFIAFSAGAGIIGIGASIWFAFFR